MPKGLYPIRDLFIPGPQCLVVFSPLPERGFIFLEEINSVGQNHLLAFLLSLFLNLASHKW
jgi:hypothetical protein